MASETIENLEDARDMLGLVLIQVGAGKIPKAKKALGMVQSLLGGAGQPKLANEINSIRTLLDSDVNRARESITALQGKIAELLKAQSSTKCPACGKPVQPGHVYCGYCGKPLKKMDWKTKKA